MPSTEKATARVAQANAQAAAGTVGGANGVSSGSSNPITAQTQAIQTALSSNGASSNYYKDAPGYVPTAQPGKNLDGSPIGTGVPTASPESATTNPANAQPTPEQTKALQGQITQAQAGVNNLAQSKGLSLTPNGTGGYTASPAEQIRKGFELANQTGITPSQGAGGGSAMVNQVMQNVGGQAQNPPAVTNFFNPENPVITDATKQLREFLNPEADRQMLNDHIKQLSTDRAELGGLKTDLMNVKRVMSGTEGDLRDEITKAGGFATESQVQALAIGRNKSLIQKAQLLSDQIQSQTDLVNSDISLIGEEKQMAAQQFSQNMSLLNYQQENAKYMQSAAKEQFKTVVDALGYDGAYLAYQNDPTQLARIEQLSGLGSGGLLQAATLAQQKRLQETSKADLQNQVSQSNLKTDIAQRANINSQIAERNVASQGDPAVDSNTLQGMLNVYKSTGVIPAFGLSAKNPLRAQFYAALGADGGIVTDANTNKTVRAGLTTAYKTQQNLLAANQTAIGTLDQQLGLVQKYSDQVSRSGSPLVNKYLLGVKTGVFGDPDAAALNNIVKTASYEFAKILSGSAASISGVSVQSAADAESMLNSAMAKGQFNKVIDLMKQESHFRIKSQQDTLGQLEKDLNNVGSVSKDLKESTKPLTPAEIPVGYYQASDGLLYKK